MRNFCNIRKIFLLDVRHAELTSSGRFTYISVKEGADWYPFPVFISSTSIELGQDTEDAGTLYRTNIKCEGVEDGIYREWAGRRFLVLVRLTNGLEYVLGTPEEPLRMEQKLTSRLTNNVHGSSLEITGSHYLLASRYRIIEYGVVNENVII